MVKNNSGGLVLVGYRWTPQYRRPALAAARALFSEVLVIDEPTSNASHRLCAFLHQRPDALMHAATEGATAWALRQVHPTRRILSPSVEIFRSFNGDTTGKRRTAQWLRAHALESHALRRYHLAKPLEWKFPMMAKPPLGTNGLNIQVLRSAAALRRARPIGYILEEAIADPIEWGFYFVAYNGRVAVLSCRRFVFNEPLAVRNRTSPGLVRHHTHNCTGSMRTFVHALVGRSGYHGFGCGNGKYANHSFKMFEVNTRLCGTILLHPHAIRAHLSAFKGLTRRDRKLRCKHHRPSLVRAAARKSASKSGNTTRGPLPASAA